MWYTFEVTESALDRLQAIVSKPLRIWHYLGPNLEDHYVAVIDLEPREAAWLYLL